jgi:pimeloyl-ACP methyl ester carboxylesterase
LRDIEVAYAEHGAGAPVVMIHGLAEDRRSFADAQARLPGFHTFACDLRGHGETGLGDADATLAQLGGDLIGFLETVTGPARCVGYSLGGTAVLWAAATRPDLIAHAVVSGTSTVVGRVAVDFFADRIRTLQSDRARFAADLRADTAAQIVTDGVDLDALTARRLEAIGDGEGYVNAARAMMRMRAEPLTPMLETIRCPVDVIGADGDVFCPRKAADIICNALADSVYHEIAGAGHLMGVDQPAAYAATLERALRRSS